MKKIACSLILLFTLQICHAAKYILLESKADVSVYYKWKVNPEGKEQLLLKFKNKSGSAQNINIEVGFYQNGVMEESAQISSCAKGSFFSNLFSPVYAVINEQLSQEQIKNEKPEISLLEFNLEKTEGCEEQH